MNCGLRTRKCRLRHPQRRPKMLSFHFQSFEMRLSINQTFSYHQMKCKRGVSENRPILTMCGVNVWLCCIKAKLCSSLPINGSHRNRFSFDLWKQTNEKKNGFRLKLVFNWLCQNEWMNEWMVTFNQFNICLWFYPRAHDIVCEQIWMSTRPWWSNGRVEWESTLSGSSHFSTCHLFNNLIQFNVFTSNN